MKGYTAETYNRLRHFCKYHSTNTGLMLFAARQKLDIIRLPLTVGERQSAPHFVFHQLYKIQSKNTKNNGANLSLIHI